MIRGSDRREIERRAGKRGVTVRHDDTDPASTKRVKRARQRPRHDEGAQLQRDTDRKIAIAAALRETLEQDLSPEKQHGQQWYWNIGAALIEKLRGQGYVLRSTKDPQ